MLGKKVELKPEQAKGDLSKRFLTRLGRGGKTRFVSVQGDRGKIKIRKTYDAKRTRVKWGKNRRVLGQAVPAVKKKKRFSVRVLRKMTGKVRKLATKKREQEGPNVDCKRRKEDLDERGSVNREGKSMPLTSRGKRDEKLRIQASADDLEEKED